MTIAQLVNGTRQSALLRVARFAKQFAQVLPAHAESQHSLCCHIYLDVYQNLIEQE